MTPADDRPRATAGRRFVVQEHHARRLHWDLRLERDGVLVSWALPRGFPDDPARNRLAIHTDDHPMEFLTFQSEVPTGEYGAGTMTIWDRGTYEAEKFTADKVVVRLDGDRVRGRFALFETDDGRWLIHRMDPPEPDRDPMPDVFVPMTARLSPTLPADDDEWAYEVTWDGVRALAFGEPGHLRLYGRDRRDVTSQYPELRALERQLGARRVVLDGELVAFGTDGRPSSRRLRPRTRATSESEISRRQRDAPVTYVVFDLLHLDGRSLFGLPYVERRGLLDELELGGANWQTPSYQRGDGAALLDATRAQGLQGLTAKRLTSTYLPGRRSSDWLKIKSVPG